MVLRFVPALMTKHLSALKAIPNVAEKNILILLEEKKIRALRDKKKIF
jgi:hypothetical protein